MFLIDDILALPFKAPVAGVKWALEQVRTMVDREMMNDEVWKTRLLELQMKLELGEISDEDYAIEEAIVFEQLREIRMRQQAQAEEFLDRQRGSDDDDSADVVIHTGYGE